MSSVILIGMPGCGKTTIMRLYEKKFAEEVWDTDEVISEKYGDISEIFAKNGEEYFRSLEAEAVRYICDRACDAFISTGGGVVLRKENVLNFRKIGVIVYLRTRPETLAERLKGDDSRPLLRGDDGTRLENLYRSRAPVYERAADLIIDTDGLDPEAVLGEIIKKVNQSGE